MFSQQLLFVVYEPWYCPLHSLVPGKEMTSTQSQQPRQSPTIYRIILAPKPPLVKTTKLIKYSLRIIHNITKDTSIIATLHSLQIKLMRPVPEIHVGGVLLFRATPDSTYVKEMIILDLGV
ncbi:hypothetical protein LB504_008777 [Fusarium proliferatum]|nr:hypothetical protein LB504_008777 [Fusarium proliferatum]